MDWWYSYRGLEFLTDGIIHVDYRNHSADWWYFVRGIFSQESYDAVIEKYPVLEELYADLKKFYEILFSKNPEHLKQYLDTLLKMEIPEIPSFAEETKKDNIVAQNGIAYDYNNGLVEGSVNKVKVIKESCTEEILLNY